MRRRNFITGIGGVGAGLAAASTMPTPAIAQGTRELRMVSTFVKNFPGLGTSANRLVERIRIASDGKLRIRLYNANELVGPLEVFDVVSKGDADIYFSSEYYYLGKSKAFGFFGAVPFGLTMDEYYAWLHYGGGQPLWDELSAQFNLKPFVSSNTGVQMGGWFNREIKTVDDFKGLKFRMPGIGGEVLRRMGAAVVTLPPPEIYQALQSGTIDATEWIGPWHDLAFGFYKIAKFYYWPGFHEPSSVTSYAVNMRVWNSLPKDQQELLKMAFESEAHLQSSEYDAGNPDALDTLLTKHNVQLRQFSNDIVKEIARNSAIVVNELANSDPYAKKVWDNYRAFAKKSVGWSKIGVQGYLNARAEYMNFG